MLSLGVMVQARGFLDPLIIFYHNLLERFFVSKVLYECYNLPCAKYHEYKIK